MSQIPKIIHYCWFGGNPLPELAHKCIASWKKYCPDYEIKEWNETNFDIHCCKYVEEAYEAKKWAFVADYARFYAMYTEGGIYVETDSELIKPIDSFLEHGAFFGFGPNTMTVPLCGTKKYAPVARHVMDCYERRSFHQGDHYNLTTVNQTLYQVLTEEYGLVHNNCFQELKEGVAVYPKEYFFSTDWTTGIITKTPELCVIHYADGSWLDDEQKQHMKIRKKAISLLGKNLGGFLAQVYYSLKKDGWSKLSEHGRRYLLRKVGPSYMKVMGKLFHRPKKVVFENFAGRGYGDNPKYIARELLAREQGYDLVWLVREGSDFKFPKGIRTVQKGTWKELFELATAKFWVDNNRKSRYIVKNEKQKYIQTWHGFYPLKKIEKDAERSLSADYIENAKYDAAMTDLMTSGCKARTKMYQNSFWYDGEVKEWGTPRNDIFFEDTDYKKLVCEHFGIDREKKLVLYAPTFRDDHSIAAYNMDYARLLKNLEKRFGGSWVCLIRLHPAVREKSANLTYPDGCVEASSYDDIQELFAGTDMLITDYSDCMFEYTLSRKPVMLYAVDIEEYERGRGLYYSIYNLPYPIATDNNVLEGLIHSFDESKYQETIGTFLNEIGSFEGGKASKMIVDYMIENTQIGGKR